MKILFIPYSQSLGGGAEAVLTTLSNALVDSKKYSITIQEVMKAYIKKEPLDEKITLRPLGIFDSKAPCKMFNRLNSYFLNNKPQVLSSLFNLNDFDVAISWNYQLPSFLLFGVRAKKKVAWFHTDIYDIDVKQHPKALNQNKMQEKVWDKVERIVTISNNSLQSLFDVFPQYKSKGMIIYNGCDTKRIETMANEYNVDWGGGGITLFA